MSIKIVNGALAAPGRFDYTMAILFQEQIEDYGEGEGEGEIDEEVDTGLLFDFQCSGTLVTPSLVLTSAECALLVDEALNSDSEIFGVLDCNDLVQGTNPLFENSTTPCDPIAFESVVIHPDLDQNDQFTLNDIGLIKLVEPSTIIPVTIAAPGLELSEEIVTEIGWGLQLPILNSEVGASTLREVDTTVINNEECENGFQNLYDVYFDYFNVSFDFIVDETLICSSGDASGFCDFDEGSPLLIKCDGEDQDLQVSVLSVGSCGITSFSSISTPTFVQVIFDFIVEQATLIGENVTTLANLNDFCLDDPVQVDNNPTPFPTFAEGAAWTCNIANFGTADGCHCNCGVPDPDCIFDTFSVFNCGGGEICNDAGLCVADVLQDESDDDEDNDNNDDDDGDNNGGLVAGIIILAVAVVLLLGFLLTKRSSNEPTKTNDEEYLATY